MRYYWPTADDMLGGMPQHERDEFLAILGRALAEVLLGEDYVPPPEPGPHRVRRELSQRPGAG